MKNTLSILSVLVFAGTLFIPALSKGMADHHSMQPQTANSADSAQKKSLQAIYEQDLQELSKALDKAIHLLQNGNSKAALAELQNVKASTEGIRQALAAHLKLSFVNNRCPIMNSPIQPERVKENLIREYKGQRIAFCCGGCPAAWDQLSDTEKQQKLSKVLIKTPQAH